jgi:two-component system sensor histidine kinase UhpB
VPADVALALYRAAQEGLTNAIRHGEARRIVIDLRPAGGALDLSVTDDGKGPPPAGSERSGHYGLRWLAERVQGLGGRVELAAALPAGARLSVRLPLTPEPR